MGWVVDSEMRLAGFIELVGLFMRFEVILTGIHKESGMTT